MCFAGISIDRYRWGLVIPLQSTTMALEGFTRRNFVADFVFHWNWILFFKNKKSLFEPPFGRLSDNVRTPSIARWKARGRLPIYNNWTYILRLICQCRKRKSVEVGVFVRWVTLSANFRRKGASPTNHCWCQKTRVMPFRVVSKYPQCIVIIIIIIIYLLLTNTFIHIKAASKLTRRDNQAKLRLQLPLTTRLN